MLDKRKYRSTSFFSILRSGIEKDFDDIQNVIEEISRDLLLKQKQISRKSESVQEDDTVECERDINKYFQVFPAYLFNSLLLALYGSFENKLKEMCDIDTKRGFSGLTVAHLAGNNYIEKSRLYLELVAEVNLHEVKEVWGKIVEVQRIRNCIAHNNANIIRDKNRTIDKQDLYRILSLEKRIRLNETTGDFYINNKEFLFDVIGWMKTYLVHVAGELAKSKTIARNSTMPYNNNLWGQEKTRNLLKDVIHGLNLYDDYLKRDDEYREDDLKENLRNCIGGMAFDLTKLYSFFCDGEWTTNDSTMIVSRREAGLNELDEIYTEGIRVNPQSSIPEQNDLV